MATAHPIIMTVTGPIAPSELGMTLAHEHVLIDLRCLWHSPTAPWQEGLAEAEPDLQNRGLLYLDPYVCRSNLLLDDRELAVHELRQFRELGGSALIDLTSWGIDPRPEALREIAAASGVNIILGCGYYVRRAHPPEVAEQSEEMLAERLIRTIREGFAGTDVRSGIIGEVGTGSPVHPDEVKVVRAAARAQRETGLAINVHVSIFAREALYVLDILDAAGADLSRVVVSHLDEMLDTDYHLNVLRRGAYVEFDTFGSEMYFDGSGEREPSDRERLDALLRLLEAGWAERLLLSQDICNKVQLRRYGGFGYGHIPRTIVPRLRRRGVDQATIDTMLIHNPARVLSHLPS